MSLIESLVFGLLGAGWGKANRFVHWMIPDRWWSSQSCLQELAGTNSSFWLLKGSPGAISKAGVATRHFSPLAAILMTENSHCYMLSWGSCGAPISVDSSRMVPFQEDNPVWPSVPAPSPSLGYLEKSKQTSAACQFLA